MTTSLRNSWAWQTSADGQVQWWSQELTLPQGRERWIIVRTRQAEERARATVQRQVEKTRPTWEKILWHLGNQAFACEADAQAAAEKTLKTCPDWLQVRMQVVAHPQHERRGRPPMEAQPVGYRYQVQTTWVIDEEAVEREVHRKTTFIVATNVLDDAQVSALELMATYKDQGSVERGFALLPGSAVSGFLGLPQKARTGHGPGAGDGPLLARLPLGRTPGARAVSSHWSDST